MGDCEEVHRRLARHLGSRSHLLACRRGNTCQQKHVAHTACMACLGRRLRLPSAACCHCCRWLQMPKLSCFSPAVHCCQLAHLPKRLLWAPLGALPAAGACTPRSGPARRPCITQAELCSIATASTSISFAHGQVAPHDSEASYGRWPWGHEPILKCFHLADRSLDPTASHLESADQSRDVTSAWHWP